MGGGGNVGLGLHCRLGLTSAILNKPRASLCLLEVSFLLRLILQYVPPQRVEFLRRFGLKTGMVLEGATGLYGLVLCIQG